MKSFIRDRFPLLFSALRNLNLLKQAYFSKYGRIPGAINYPLSVALQWPEIAARRKGAEALTLPAELASKLQELKAEGFCKLRLSDVVADAEGSDLLRSLSSAAEVFGTPSHDFLIENLGVGKTKSYFYDIAKSNVEVRSKLEAFAKSPKAVALAAKYLGQMPLIESVSFIYSPPTNATRLIAAQGWHLDREQKTKLKIFLSPFEVSASSGPTTLLPLKHSTGRPYPNFPGYFDDAEALAAGIAVHEKVQLLNDVGEFYMADTSRLFHYGARDQTQPRFLVIVSYCPLESRLSRHLRRDVKKKSIQYGWQPNGSTVATRTG